MKHLKAKLMATVMSLTLSLLMLTSASFAWFTISTAPEVRDMSANVATNKNLEIALAKAETNDGIALPDASGVNDVGQNMKWGNLVDLKGYFLTSGATPSNTITLKPVQATYTAGVPTFSAPQFGSDGRIKQVTALNKLNVGTSGSPNFSDMGGLYAYSDTNADTTGDHVWAYEVDYWLRSNVEGNISLTTARARGDSDSEAGLGSFITNDKITVKFAVYPAVYENGVYTELGTPVLYSGVLGEVSSGKYPITLSRDVAGQGAGEGQGASSFKALANKEYLVKMYVYFDGGNMTNADFTGIGQTCTLNVQFASDSVAAADAMQVTMVSDGNAASANSTGG